MIFLIQQLKQENMWNLNNLIHFLLAERIRLMLIFGSPVVILTDYF